jgi:HAD superfamily hydrolase (TIGR01509 family)
MLFDVDGTLVDSNGAHARAWTDALVEHGVDTDIDRVRGLIGMGADKLLPALAGISETSDRGKAIVQRKKELFDRVLPELRPTRGARALLSYLHQNRIALATATSADDQELGDLLRQAGLDDLIPTRTSRDDASGSKPDPDIVAAALERVGTPPDRTVLIGDTPYDIAAASRAGLPSIALRCGGHWPDEALAAAVAIYDDPLAVLGHWSNRRERLP